MPMTTSLGNACARSGGKGGYCNVKVPHHGKGGHDGIVDMPDFTAHRCKEHCVWVFWR